MINLLYYLLYTLDTLKRKNPPPLIQSNCCKSYIPDYMAVFLVGKPAVVKDGFSHVLMCLFMVQHIIKQHFTGSKLANWRALKRNNELRGSWRAIKKFVIGFGKSDGSPRKETISELLHFEYFWAPEQIFMGRESCFCLKSRFWLWCTVGKPLCTADLKSWNSHDVTFFYWSATTPQRHVISSEVLA